MQIFLHTLGCPKNEVDSERMASLLASAGHQLVSDPNSADAIVVNTCGFVESAKQESIEWLLHYAGLVRRNKAVSVSRHSRRRAGADRAEATRARKPALIAAGCLAQRYSRQLLAEMPELSGVLGSLRWGEIEACLREASVGSRPCWTGPANADPQATRLVSGPSAYLKIAEGCSTRCAFCAIPQIKGPLRSRPADEVVAEAKELARDGVTEVILVAQDTTAYGHDRGERDGLADLIDSIVSDAPEISWLRILYAHPEHITDRLLLTMAAIPQITKYLDLPLQHADPGVLARMKRPVQDMLSLVTRARQAVPGLALRSSFIVGYPGETEEEFDALLAFLEQARLDRVGVFVYSAEDGTPAASLPGRVPQKQKAQRYDRVMRLQRGISLERNRELIGQTLDVLVEAEMAADESQHLFDGAGAVGRSYRDAPEIDGQVYIATGSADAASEKGSLVAVRITGATEYDLHGEAVGVVRRGAFGPLGTPNLVIR